MRQPDYSGQFKRDVKQAQKRGKDMDKLRILLALLINDRGTYSPCRAVRMVLRRLAVLKNRVLSISPSAKVWKVQGRHLRQ
jgi:hypothetical protein